jgi:DNA uptake protein ComE-like DNA-binding protein
LREALLRDLPERAAPDINTASTKDLEMLPDVTAMEAKAIIAGRPYRDTSQLVSRHILSKTQYDKIRPQIGVK